VESTGTKTPSLLSKALEMPWEQKATLKSVRIRQADEAMFAADRAAGLAANRKADAFYKDQTNRALEATVDQYVQKTKGKPMPDDEETVHQDLGDRYQEIHHHHAAPREPAQASGHGLVGKILPWILAAAMGPLGGLAGWWLNREPTVNVMDVQSKFKVEVYDENGTLLDTYPYAELQK